LTKIETVNQLLGDRALETDGVGKAYAPANVALCKYWGKRDAALNLPVTSSLSISLGDIGTTTEVRLIDGADRISLNGERVAVDQAFAIRLTGFLDFFRPTAGRGFAVDTVNTVPTAAGVASSASGYAAIVLALDDLFGWGLTRRELSILARLGSGSASRSVYDGFVKWHRGEAADGMDSFAERLDVDWPELRVGLVVVADSAKPIGSSEAMARTVATSTFYQQWGSRSETDLVALEGAVAARDFRVLGEIAESNALAMHAMMLTATPPILYWTIGTVDTLHKIWALRETGTPVYATIDAGPNVKVLFEAENAGSVEKAFPGVRIVAPCGSEEYRY
jgi:diphosphomevalonate decarboxylase